MDRIQKELAKLAASFEREAKKFKKKAVRYKTRAEQRDAQAALHEAECQHELVCRHGVPVERFAE